MDGIHITKYKVAEHYEGAQKLIDRYLMPFYLGRMGVKDEDRAKYLHIEPILNPSRIKDSAFEFASYVALDSNGRVIGCYINYVLTKPVFQGWGEYDKGFANDSSLPKSIRNYCQHAYALFDGLERKIFDQHNINEVIYCESVITAPEFRGHHLGDLVEEIYKKEHGSKYHFLFDSTMPIELYMSKINRASFSIPVGSVHDDYTLIKKALTYDQYVVLIKLSKPELMSLNQKKPKL